MGIINLKRKDIFPNYLENALETITKIQEVLNPLGFKIIAYKEKNKINRTLVLHLEQNTTPKPKRKKRKTFLQALTEETKV